MTDAMNHRADIRRCISELQWIVAGLQAAVDKSPEDQVGDVWIALGQGRAALNRLDRAHATEFEKIDGAPTCPFCGAPSSDGSCAGDIFQHYTCDQGHAWAEPMLHEVLDNG